MEGSVLHWLIAGIRCAYVHGVIGQRGRVQGQVFLLRPRRSKERRPKKGENRESGAQRGQSGNTKVCQASVGTELLQLSKGSPTPGHGAEGPPVQK